MAGVREERLAENSTLLFDSAILLNQLYIFASKCFLNMTSTSFLKSKAFKQREENAREKVRQASKQDLLADLSR